MKNLKLELLLNWMLLLGLISLPSLAFAGYDSVQNYDQASATPAPHRANRQVKRAYRLGICVGQTLAQQGIIIPDPQPGQPQQNDSSLKAALKQARESCSAKLFPKPSPAPAATPAPSPAPAP